MASKKRSSPSSSSSSSSKAPREAKKLKISTNKTQTPPTFAVGDDKALEYLKENGFCVFRDVIPEEKNTIAVDKLWTWLESLGTGIKRNNVKTWVNKNWPEMFVYGILDRYGIGQSDFLWYLRQECRSVFEFICGTKELLTSVFRPWMEDDKWKTTAGWWHFDCSKNVPEDLSVDGLPDCIQGALCLTEASDASGGFACVPKSHLKWDAFFETYKDKSRNHWAPIDPTDPICKGGVRVLAPKNSMICWNSKLIHCNAPGSGYHPSNKLLRIAAYISMQSSALLSAEKRTKLVEKRKAAINKYGSTSHWSIFCQLKQARHQRSKYSNPITPASSRQTLPDLSDPSIHFVLKKEKKKRKQRENLILKEIKDLVEGTYLQQNNSTQPKENGNTNQE